MSGLIIEERQVGNVTILDLRGDITVAGGSDTLRRAINDLGNKGRWNLLLNVARVVHVDSSGLGSLVRGLTTFRREGGEMKILNLTERIKDLMVITKLVTVFDAHHDERAAVDSFHKHHTDTMKVAC